MNTMAFNADATPHGFTILRIKRKRDEEVPEVLVVEPSTKKGSKRRKSGIDVFQFAETVDAKAWKDVEQEQLRNRISELTKTSPSSPKKPDSDAMSMTSDAISRQSSQSQARQYRVVPKGELQSEPRRQSRNPTMPPKVLSSRDLEKASSSLKIYDAILAPSEPEIEIDPEMEKFQNLLQDYLTVNESIPARPLSNTPSLHSSTRILTPSSSDEYVYDIFYHRPSTLSEWAEMANMATVTGLPAMFDDDYDYESESEEEDQEDEDSNAEDFYKNDYPDEESQSDSSDMFHDYSADEFEVEDRFEPDD